jgi:hypothetical protein
MGLRCCNITDKGTNARCVPRMPLQEEPAVRANGEHELLSLNERSPHRYLRGGFGYCGITRFASDCAPGRVSGSWKLSEHQRLGFEAACVERCKACEHCRFVSFAKKWRDCSWYTHCNLDRLQTTLLGYYTLEVAERSATDAGTDASSWAAQGALRPKEDAREEAELTVESMGEPAGRPHPRKQRAFVGALLEPQPTLGR